MQVAELFASLGLRPDAAAWSKGTALITSAEKAVHGLEGAFRGVDGRWRAANGRFLTMAEKAKLGGNALQGLNAKALGLDATLRGLAMRVAAVFGGAQVAQWTTSLSDSHTNLENRLRQVSSSEEELQSLMQRTRKIADDTRSDWGATGEAFVRLVNATKDLGVSQERALDITETLNMALQSSGASANEAAAGSLQLMQGLASGALQGDEFRSIAEQLPDLLDLFAQEMGVSRGELKKLGAEGKITSKVVISALENASESVRQKFAASTATAAQQWTLFKNDMMEVAAEFARDTGLVEKLGAALRAAAVVLRHVAAAGIAVAGAIAESINWFTEGSDEAQAVLIGIAAVIMYTVVPALYAMVAGWVAAAAPILAIVAVVAGVAYGIMKLVKHWDTVRAAAVRFFQSIPEYAARAAKLLLQIMLRVLFWPLYLGRLIIQNWDKIKEAGGRAWEWIKARAVDAFDFIKAIPGRILDGFVALGEGIIEAIGSAFDWVIQKAKDAASEIWAEIKDIPVIGRVAKAAEWAVDKISGGDASSAGEDVVRDGERLIGWLAEHTEQGESTRVAPDQHAPSISAPGNATSITNTTSINAPITVHAAPGMSEAAVAEHVQTQLRRTMSGAIESVRGGRR